MLHTLLHSRLLLDYKILVHVFCGDVASLRVLLIVQGSGNVEVAV
ncbi:hypothetical protein APHMUC_0927 [Anaplasma phagocytophilum str. ApMUC09]|uniref:Uncharacterized protein n=1 Tax=Anaplasma phagocytophilum str. ApMUC09 TaxID=1359152 RepID=A0A0F3N7T7_ANAPH|nr:hypothetical protein APHMUC_0927 [Anaplasma phagocytophilum str. ApMUC09]